MVETPPHPFLETIEGVISTTTEPPFEPRERARLHLSSEELRTKEVGLPGLPTFELRATPEVPTGALDHLASRLTVLDEPVELHKDLLEMLDEEPRLLRGEPEIALPVLRDERGRTLFISWPDGWEMTRPGVLRPRLELRPYLDDLAEEDGTDGTDKERREAIGSATEALVGRWNTIQGRLQCSTGNPLPHVQVFLGEHVVNADANGNFRFDGSFSEIDRLDIGYDAVVASGGVSSPITLVRDDEIPRTGAVDVPTGITAFSTLDVGTLQLDTTECELFEVGAEALASYHSIVGASPPAGGLRMKLFEHVVHVNGTPYAYHDHIVFPTNFRSRAAGGRRETIFHEFGHTIRHVADGGRSHWEIDNIRFWYGRSHDGTEVFNEHYAFNEGWAQYWECTRPGVGACPTLPAGVPGNTASPPAGSADPFVDWNEMQVGRRLLTLSAEPGAGHAFMVGILTANPGAIHTLWELEQHYCATVPLPNRECDPATRRPLRAKQPCPPGFEDDGAFCRQPDVLAKDSYPRHGDIPAACATGSVEHGGLCHGPCPTGFDAWGFHCWGQCPAGMHDDGAFCRRDVDIINAQNSCPWHDVCGLFNDCTTCPPGYHNDGCTCRRDAWIFAKESFERSVDPPGCDAGMEYVAGLCYEPCRPGFSGVGSVCWGSCPPGYDDHGATCYRPPNIFIK